MIGVLNYGVGNVQAILNCYKSVFVSAVSVDDESQIPDCSHLILPGVGSFDHAMQAFNRSGLRDATAEHALHKKKPFLGICVGMQMLGYSSAEGDEEGLGFIPGHVRQLNSDYEPIPHMGWNTVTKLNNHDIMKDIPAQPEFYFLHSYVFINEYEKDKLGVTSYGEQFCSLVMRDNVYGMQCHPEKSHFNGQLFLKNFGMLESC